MSLHQSSERSAGNDSVATAPRVERAEPNIDRMSDFKSFDSIVNKGGTGTQVASMDAGAGFPSHADYSFYNSSAYGTVVGDGNIKAAATTAAATTDNPNAGAGTDSHFNPPNYYNDFKQDASKFAYGTALTDGQAADGKDKLQRLTEEMYRTGGDKLLQGLAGDISKDAVDKFGEAAFDKAPKAFDDSVAKVTATQNKDGSTQVQWDFAQPNSGDAKTVIFQLPKNTPASGGYQEVFPDSTKDTYVR